MLKSIVGVFFLAAFAQPLMAAEQCAITVESNDAMQYNVKEIPVSKKCKEFVITLKHVGKLPKNAMGHNMVITKSSEMAGVGTDGMVASETNDYIKPKDARVLGHTKLLGPGDSGVIKLNVGSLSEKESYTFFCTFPGHSALMKGVLKVVG